MKVRKIILVCLIICATICATAAISACGGCNGKKDETYTVSYARGAEDATGTVPEPVSYAEGATVTLAAANTFSRSGYIFDKWSYGGTTYGAGESFTMPASDVTFTAVWKQNQTENPPVDENDEPTLTELDSKFYSADNWVFMTNNNGASYDTGEIPYVLNDGSIKFHRLNQAIEIGDLSNSTASFMLKGTNDWSIWFNSSSKDNSNNYSYRLAYSNGGLRLVLSSAPDLAAAVVSDSTYKKAEWNRIDIAFETTEKTCKIKLYVNGERAGLSAGDNVAGVTVSDNLMTHAQPAMFTTGNYMVVKVWEAHNILQIKPVADKDEEDVPVIACIGASITEGAGLPDEYIYSYPAQLQQRLGGAYNVLNFGNSGKTVTLSPDDGEPWLEQYQWEGVQAIVPDIVIFNIGTNDSKEANLIGGTTAERKAAFKGAFENLLDEVLSVNTLMDVYICTVPYAYSDVWGINNDNINNIVAPAQREVAQENGYHLIDIYEYSKNKSLLFRDGVHPHANGFTMFVDIIEKMLKEGDAALTEQFLADIDTKYNDKVTGFTAEVEDDGDKLNLVVSGNTTLSSSAGIKVAIGDDNGYSYFTATVADGKFSASIDLTELEFGSRWYNVRIYVYDGTYYPEHDTFFHLLLLDETEYAKEQIITKGETKLTVKSWDSDWGATFSFALEAYFELTVSSATVAESNGNIILTVSGTSSVDNLTLSVDDDGHGKQFTQDITVSNGVFSLTYELSLIDVTADWYYVRLVYNGTNYDLMLEQVTDVEGNPLTENKIFNGAERRITVKTYAGKFALLVSNPPAADDKPVLAELDNRFYVADNWEYMTNNDGASNDAGDIVYALDDGSVKFHRVNQAIDIGEITKASFMLKATDTWTIWFNSSSKDNKTNTSYRLQYSYGELKLIIHDGSDITAARVQGSNYAISEWNRFDIECVTENGVSTIKLYVNEERAQLIAGSGTSNDIKVEDNCLIHTRPVGFGGNYLCVKVWNAQEYVQIKPVANKDVADVPVIAAIGASITEGSNADNFYTESYPAQLQNLLGGSYNVINFGNSGKTVNPAPGDGAAWMAQNQWLGVQAIKPDIIIVNIGTNDSKPDNFLGKDGFKTAYVNFINAIKAVNPDMEIYICTVPTAYSNSYNISNDNIRDTIAVVQREVAEEYGYHLIDLYSITQNKSLLFDDGIHPHSLGYGMFAEIIKKMITEGDAAITSQYLETIDAKYNDKLDGFTAEITADGNKINLTVSGNTTLSASATIKVQLRVSDSVYYDYEAVISNGRFTATVDLSTLESAYYNIRVYVYDRTYYPVENSFYHLVLLSDTDGYVSGQIFHSDSKQVKLASWTSGWGATLSISSISDYHYINLTSATLTEEQDGKINLTLSGNTGDSGLRLYVGNDEATASYYHEITVTAGTFTVTFDLATLSADGGWYNVRIYFADNTYYTVTYQEVKKADGTTSLTTSDVFYGLNEGNPEGSQGVKVSIKTWGSENPLSLSVENYDNSYSITPTEVKFENGNLVFSGTVKNIQKIDVYLYNSDTDYLMVTAELQADGSFTVSLGLEQLTAGAGNWYRLKVSADGKELETLSYYEGFDTGAEYYYKTRRYYFTTEWSNTDIALVYGNRSFNYTVDSAVISEKDGKATLTLTGTVDSDVVASDIKLLLDKTSAATQQLTLSNTATVAGTFSFVYDISELYLSTKFTQTQEEGYFIRLVIYGTNINISSEKVKDQLFEAVEISGYTYYFYRNSLTAYNTLGIVRIDSSELDTSPVVTQDSVKFENGEFVFTGTVKNVNTLYVYLINTNVADSLNNYVEAVIDGEGKFTATFSLDALAAISGAAGQPLNLRYKVDDITVATTNVTQGTMSLEQYVAYNGNTYMFALNSGCVAVKFKATVTEVIATYVGFEEDCLVVRATAVNVSSLKFIIQNTVASTYFLYEVEDVQLAEDGSFELKISLEIFEGAASNANLNFRAYVNGATSVTQITQNSTCSIAQTYEYGDRVYKFALNGTTVSMKY